MNLSRESGLHRAALRARKALDELRREASSTSRKRASERPARRDEAFRHARRPRRCTSPCAMSGLCARASQGRLGLRSRIHASVDLGLQEQVTRLARRYLNSFRGAGARQVAVMVAERGELRELQRHSRRSRLGAVRCATLAQLQTARSQHRRRNFRQRARNIGGATSDSAARNIGGATSDSALETSAAQLQTAPLETSAAL